MGKSLTEKQFEIWRGKGKGKILAIGAHPDDIEIGCGATLAMHSERVVVCTFTDCGVPEEWHASMAVLRPHNKALYKLRKRVLHQHGAQLRDLLVKLKEAFHPTIIFTHHPSNPHQDHQAVFRETQRIFKRETLIGYSIAGWYTPNLYIPVTEQARLLKAQMLACYKSQEHHEDGKYRFSRDPLVQLGNLSFHGMHISRQNAEAFELLRGVFPIA